MELLKVLILKRHYVLKAIYETYGRQWKSTKDCLKTFNGKKHDRTHLLNLFYSNVWTRMYDWRSRNLNPIRLMDKETWNEDICPGAKANELLSAYYKVTIEGLHFLVEFMNVEVKDEDAAELAKHIMTQEKILL